MILSLMVMVSSACKVKAPAFHVVPPPVLPPLLSVLSRNKSALITISSGSIKIAPCAPLAAAADSWPPASSTVLRAENSTKPPSPIEPPSAETTAPDDRVERLSAMMMTLPPSLLIPRPSAEIFAPSASAISPPALIDTSPAF